MDREGGPSSEGMGLKEGKNFDREQLDSETISRLLNLDFANKPEAKSALYNF